MGFMPLRKMRTGLRAFGPGRYGWLMSTREMRRFKRAGELQMESFLKRINEKRDVETHDLGFMYSPSCVAGYKLTKSAVGREAAIKAAEELITRFHEKGQFIQAWGPLDAPDNYRLIIDCLLNLPLLYWASQETGDPKFKDIAERHIHTALANVIRPDFSTWHTFFFNRETGGTGSWCHLPGIPGRLRLGQRTGLGDLRNGHRV